MASRFSRWARQHPQAAGAGFIAVAAGLVAIAIGVALANLNSPVAVTGPSSEPSPPSTVPSVSPFATATLPSSVHEAPSSTPTATPSGPHVIRIKAGMVQVVTDNLRVRQSPGDGQILAVMQEGQLARATGRSEARDGLTWIQIVQQPSDRTGWVAVASADGEAWVASVRDGPVAIMTGGDIELIDPDSGARHFLSRGLAVHDGAFSPDGTEFALMQYGFSPTVVSLSEVATVASLSDAGVFAEADLKEPGFSPDGEWLLFFEDLPDIYSVRWIWLGTEGATPQMPNVATFFPPHWAPDSGAYTTAVNYGQGTNDNWEVVVAKVDGHVRRITRDSQWTGMPVWAPDGSQIVFGGNTDRGEGTIETMLADGSQRQLLVVLPRNLPSGIGDLTMSPDGTWLAQLYYGDDGSAVVYFLNPRTLQQRRVIAPGGWCEDLTWSPTGTRLAMVCGPSFAQAEEAFVMDLDGGNIQSLGSATAIDWGRTLKPSVK
jgi:WD40-like Beta Propeller Repeat